MRESGVPTGSCCSGTCSFVVVVDGEEKMVDVVVSCVAAIAAMSVLVREDGCLLLFDILSSSSVTITSQRHVQTTLRAQKTLAHTNSSTGDEDNFDA